jgi:Tfp pilus assembly protein PilV
MLKNKFTNYNKDRSGGFTLLGVLFSAFLAILVIAAIASLFAQSYSSSRSSKNRFIAVGLAKEGIELVRNIRDGNWLYYTPVADGTPVTSMKWRGEAGNTFSCSLDSNNVKSCLKSLCDGDYTIDALATDLVLEHQNPTAAEKILKLSTEGYNHSSGSDSIFSRWITISTDTSGVSGSISGACGEYAESQPTLPTTLNKPAPIIVKSTVQWKDSPNGTTRTLELQETLYDWIVQRP